MQLTCGGRVQRLLVGEAFAELEYYESVWHVNMPNDLVQLMIEVIQHVQATDSVVSANRKRGVSTYPIPFFGDLPNASVVTIGVNPSATEFEEGRWPSGLDAASLTHRLLNYFSRPPHPWFAAWEEALLLFGASYSKNAAHVDVSPRATVNSGAAADKAAFEQMLALDLPWMIRFLDTAPNLRVLLMAGSTSSALYVNEFIAKKLDPMLGHLEGSLKRPVGRGKVKHHVLVMGARRIPVSFGPGSWKMRRYCAAGCPANDAASAAAAAESRRPAVG